MSDKKQRLGKRGEELAICLLVKEGYRIETKNFRCPFGEVDIIARDKGILAFIEVKTRMNQRFGSGLEAVNYHKQLRLNRIALYYMSSHEEGKGEQMCRFDVVSVTHDSTKGWKAELIRNAFPFLHGSN